MITGFNTNVRYSGRVFHVQTEDSGRDHPHVISHLYYGGTILASEKSDYAESLEAADLTGLVRRMMEEQHKDMLRRLTKGAFDAVIRERLGNEPADEATDTAPQPAAPAAAPAPAAAAEPVGADARAFGESVVTDKPLDEVILEYLVEKSRTRGPHSRE